MKNRTYKKHNRAITEIRPGVWQCRLMTDNGMPDLNPILLSYKESAFLWLNGDTKNTTHRLYADIMSRLRRAKSKSQRQKIALAWNVAHDPKFLAAGGRPAAQAWYRTLDEETAKGILAVGQPDDTPAARKRIDAAFRKHLNLPNPRPAQRAEQTEPGTEHADGDQRDLQ